MKKISIAFLIALFCSDMISAQIRVSHPRDTINYPAPNYFFNRWGDSIDMIHPDVICYKQRTENRGQLELDAYHHTDTPISIAGIAAAIFTNDEYDLYLPIPPTYCWEQVPLADSTFDNWIEYLRLYDATDTGLVLLGEGAYSALDTARCLRSYFNRNIYENGGMLVDTVRSIIVPIYEVFFDKPITVTDSFYVGMTNYHCIIDSEAVRIAGWDAMLEGVYTHALWLGRQEECIPALGHIRYRDGFEGWLPGDCQYCIWAILDTTPIPADTCKSVTGLAVTQDSTDAVASWTRGDFNQKWQVAYGRADADPEGYTILNTTSESYVLRHLTPGVEYAVRVRASCFDDTTYSEWCDTVRFVRQGTPQGIGSVLQPYTSIAPNPAHGRMTVARLSTSAASRSTTCRDMPPSMLRRRGSPPPSTSAACPQAPTSWLSTPARGSARTSSSSANRLFPVRDAALGVASFCGKAATLFV